MIQFSGRERLHRAAQRLANAAERAAEGNESDREEIDSVLAEIVGAQREIFGPRPRSKRGEGARYKILHYLQVHVGREVSGEELRMVSGIGEWARRVRE